MRKFFIDCGAWTGCSINYIKEHYPDFKIYSFEPLPENLMKLEKYDDIVLFNKAVWDSNGFTKFFKGLSESGSLYGNKKTGNVDKNDYITVETIDLSQWIKDNFHKDDYIVLKLNVEGAEYKILDKMYRDGTLDMISEYYVQWHWNKIDYPKDEHDRISSMILWKPWNVMKLK